MENNGKTVPENANAHCPGLESQNAGKEDACAGCPNQKVCASGEATKEDPAVAEIAEKFKSIKHKILVLSGKGGVGKSTFSSQLALTLAMDENINVGLLDIDICGPSVPRMMGLEGQEIHQSNEGWSPVYVEDNLAVMSVGFLLPNKNDAVIWRGPRKNGLIKQFLTDVVWDNLDYLIIDTPPGTSDEHISIIKYLKEASLDGAIIITTPQEVALLDVRKEINFCRKTDTNVLGVVENMSGFVCPQCKCESQIFPPVSGGATAMCEEMGCELLGQIPLDPNLLLSTEGGTCYYKENSESQTSIAIKQIVDKIVDRCSQSEAKGGEDDMQD